MKDDTYSYIIKTGPNYEWINEIIAQTSVASE